MMFKKQKNTFFLLKNFSLVLISLFDGISTFVGYLMPNPSLVDGQ